MKLRFFHAVLIWAGVLTAWADPLPIYNVVQPILTNPTPAVDATAFVNNSTFSMPAGSSFLSPYDTLFYTNNGTMSGLDIGLELDNLDPNTGNQFLADTVNNRSLLTGSAWLLIDATNIINSGLMEVGLQQGLMHLTGTNVSLANSQLFAGASPNTPVPDLELGIINKTNFVYVNPYGINDLYWGRRHQRNHDHQF